MRLVLLHALPLDARMWNSIRMRYPDAYVPTLYGLGSAVCDWAAAILSACSHEDLLVVGSSIGGSCALEMARTAPTRSAVSSSRVPSRVSVGILELAMR